VGLITWEVPSQCPPLGCRRRRLARQPTMCRLLLGHACPASSSVGGKGDGTDPDVTLPSRGEDVVDSAAGGRADGRHCRCRAAEEGVSCRSCRRHAAGPYLARQLSAFRPRGVPGPTSKLSLRVLAQMGPRETEHKGGGETAKGNSRPSCCPAPRADALAVGGYKRSCGRERERELVRRPVLPRGQPSRTRALDLPFIDIRRGPRCTMGGVAMC
jgi:hypothetical protein